MKAALKQSYGMICCQAECIWLDLPLIKKLMAIGRHLFPSVAYGNVSTPTYPCGTLGFIVCSLAEVKEIGFVF
jgi:spermidine synthase